MKKLVEEIAYKSIKRNNPALLRTIQMFINNGFSPERIVDICVEKTNQPRHRLAFIGCAADYIIDHALVATETVQ
jgi:phosphoenolpyruvate-protein kinase (PTS system EI component)